LYSLGATNRNNKSNAQFKRVWNRRLPIVLKGRWHSKKREELRKVPPGEELLFDIAQLKKPWSGNNAGSQSAIQEEE